MFKWIPLCFSIVLISYSSFAQVEPTPTPPIVGEAEAGAILVSGSSDSESYATKLKTVFTQNKNIYTFSGHYIRATANGTESARNWDGALRYDRELSDLWSVFICHKVESDIFGGYLQRDSTDTGFKYTIIKDTDLNWFAEAGIRYAKTQPTTGAVTYENFGRVYSEVNKSYDKTLSFKYWVEYLPNFTDGQAFQLNTEPSLNVMLSSVFSLKLGYLLQYQNRPPADGKYATTTTTMNLVAKF